MRRLGGRRAGVGLAALALAAALAAAWLIADPHTPDLAAQVYRVGLVERDGLTLWNTRWYGGHLLPGYSLLFPALGSLLGLRLLAVLAVLTSALLFERLLAVRYRSGTMWPALWFAAAAAGDIWIGRVTFALGVTLALAAALAFARRHVVLAVLLAALCAAASPVAAFLLGFVALVTAVARRSWSSLLALAVPGAAVVLALALLFGEGGWEPFPIRSFAATAVVVLVSVAALPHAARTLRLAGIAYLLVCTGLLLVHTPVGSNIERLGVLLAGPLLLCAWLGRGAGEALPRRLPPRALAALALIAVWVAWGPVRETAAVSGSPATRAAYYAPVVGFLDGLPDGPVRVEVPLTRSHWEAALLAPHVSLARGWEKQLEERYDRVLLAPGLTPARYHAWLRGQAVAYVALPDAEPDPSSAREARLIRAGLPFLQQVFASAHWRIFRVLDAVPLASGAGRLLALGSDSFAVQAARAGSITVRVRYTRYLQVTAGTACVRRAPDGWTAVTFARPGTARVAARFSLAAAFGSPRACRR